MDQPVIYRLSTIVAIALLCFLKNSCKPLPAMYLQREIGPPHPPIWVSTLRAAYVVWLGRTTCLMLMHDLLHLVAEEW
jgi:hypothetical protein